MHHDFTRWLLASSAHRTAPKPWRPQLIQLEDRTTPVTVAGNAITLDDANEVLLISTSVGGTYTLVSSTDGAQAPFVPAAGTVTIDDTVANTGVTFLDSTANYANSFTITLDNGSTGVTFTGATNFGANVLIVTTDASIGGAGTIAGSSMALSASTGIGTSGTPLTTNISNLEAATGTGGIFVNDSGTLTIGGVSALDGVSAGGGDISIVTNIGAGDASITVSEAVANTGGGSITLHTANATSVSGNINVNATVTASGGDGNVSLLAEDNLGLSAAVSATGAGDITLVADPTVGPSANAGNVTNSGSGTVTTATGDVLIAAGDSITIGAAVSTGGTGTITIIANRAVDGVGIFTSSVSGTITTAGGDISIRGLDIDLGGVVDATTAAGSDVFLNEQRNGITLITIGADVGFGLTDADLNLVTAETLHIGESAQTAGIVVTGATALTGSTHLAFVTSGNIVVNAGASLASAAGNISFTANSMQLDSTGSVSAAAGTITLAPLTAGTAIDVGGADAAGTLGIDNNELNTITAVNIVIGQSTSGNISLTADITRLVSTNVGFVTAGDIASSASAGSFDTGGGTLTLTAGGAVRPLRTGTDFTASTVTFAAGTDLALAIGGAPVDTGFTQLNVSGAVDLTGVDLILSGAYAPLVGDSFALVSAASVTGTFNGLTLGTVVTFNGVNLHAFYTTTSATLEVNRAPTGVSPGGPYTINEGDGLSVTAQATDPDGDALTYTWDVNGDGTFGDEVGATITNGGRTVTFTPAQLLALGLGDGTITRPLAVRVSDGLTGVTTVAGSLTVNNANPTITSVDVPSTGVSGKPLAFTATATDPAGSLDPLAFAWTVTRNGVLITTGSGANFTFTPAVGGTFVVTLTVTDGDGGTATATRPISVTPPPLEVTAIGGTVTVRGVIDGSVREFVPFPGFDGGVGSVATDDLNGDGLLDIVAGAGAGGGPHVKVFDGASGAEVASFFAFAANFSGGVFVAAGGGRIVVGAGAGGGPHVKAFTLDGSETASFFAYDAAFTGGVRVAVGDVNGDGVVDIVTGAGAGGGPHVKVFDGVSQTETLSFYAFDAAFNGGVFVAATVGRIAVGADAGGGPHVKAFDSAGAETASFFAYDASFSGGVRVAFADVDADGDQNLLTAAGPGGGPHVKAFNIAPFLEIESVFVGDATDTRGVVV